MAGTCAYAKCFSTPSLCFSAFLLLLGLDLLVVALVGLQGALARAKLPNAVVKLHLLFWVSVFDQLYLCLLFLEHFDFLDHRLFGHYSCGCVSGLVHSPGGTALGATRERLWADEHDGHGLQHLGAWGVGRGGSSASSGGVMKASLAGRSFSPLASISQCANRT